MKQWIRRLGALGDAEGDSAHDRLQHSLLVYMGVLMSIGGLTWGSICAFFGLWLQSSIPYGYTVLTVVNMAYFYVSKDFRRVRFFQVLMSLLLPFLFQWVLGGFAESGAVMLWAMLAIVGSMAFSSPRDSIRWLAIYSALTLASGLIEGDVQARFAIHAGETALTAFYVINIVTISAIVFGLTIWTVSQRDAARLDLEEASRKLENMNESLEAEVEQRTHDLSMAFAQSKAVLDNMADALIAVRATGEIQAANPAFLEMFGLKPPLEGRRFAELLTPPLAALAERSLGGDAVRDEVQLPEGRIGAAVSSPIGDAQDSAPIAGAVVIVRDVTHEKEVDRMKTDFIATVSHELRTPLTSVLGFAQLTLKGLEKRVFPLVPEDDKRACRAMENAREQMGIIISEGHRLTALINDVLDIAKMESGGMEWDFESLDPAALLTAAVDATSGLFPPKGPVKLELDLEPGLTSITGDRNRLMQVLINLISNAAKFTRQGKVVLRARALESGIEIEVEDTGPGIPASEQEAIFERFRQVGDTMTDKPEGTGLGLPICRQIVTAHRGQVFVRSAPGEGSTFTVTLPADPRPEVRQNSAPPEPAPMEHTQEMEQERRAARPVVLVVEDDASQRGLLREQLTERGFEVRLCATGADAVRSVRKAPPDALVLDVLLPDISGYDVVTLLHAGAATKDVPVVFISVTETQQTAERFGVQGYLRKPADPDKLAEHLRAALPATPTR